MKIVASLIVFATIVAAATAATCRVSGDPHWTTFDGPKHDYQGQGVFAQVINNFLDIHTTHIHCNIRIMPRFVTCIRAHQVLVKDGGGNNVLVEYSPGVGSTRTAVTIDGVSAHRDTFSSAQMLSNGFATVQYTGGRLVIQGTELGFKVVMGNAYLWVEIPAARGFLGQTFGLCGHYTGSSAAVFTNTTGHNYRDGQTINPTGRYNGLLTNQWGDDFAVAAGGNIEPLSNRYIHHDTESNELVVLMDTPTPQHSLSPEEVAANEIIQFSTLQDLENAETACANILTAGDKDTLLDCEYDFAALGLTDTETAISNELAAQANGEFGGPQTSTNEETNSAAVVGGSIAGAVALVAVIAAAALFLKLRKTQKAHNALIVRENSANGSFGQKFSSGDVNAPSLETNL